MKIGFVLDDSLDKSDGVQQYILTVASWMMTHGHEVHFLVGETARRDLANVHSLGKNVKVKFNQNRMSIPLPARKSDIERVVTAEAFDILHVQMPYSPTLGAKVVNAAPSATAVVGTFHSLPFSRWHHRANRALGAVLKKNLKRFDGFISVSDAARKFAKATYGFDSIVIPNTVETGRFAGAEPFPDESTKHIVFVGRLVERKGCEYLLRAAHQLVADGLSDFVVDVCGRGELEPRLKKYVDEHGLADKVRFHGFVTEEDKARYLVSADVAVFPATGGESFGIVLIEAMAAGSKVVLGGDNPGYASVLRAEQLFSPRKTRQLATKLASYLDDSPAGQVRSKEATDWQQHAVKQYDIDVVGRQLEDYYREALLRRGDVR